MPENELVLRGLEAYELLDASATLLKSKHKRFGEYAKKLNTVMRQTINIPKGMHQPWWTIATRVFSIYYTGGHSRDVGIALARALAGEMGLDQSLAESLASAIYTNMSKIVGEKSRPGTTEEVF